MHHRIIFCISTTVVFWCALLVFIYLPKFQPFPNRGYHSLKKAIQKEVKWNTAQLKQFANSLLYKDDTHALQKREPFTFLIGTAVFVWGVNKIAGSLQQNSPNGSYNTANKGQLNQQGKVGNWPSKNALQPALWPGKSQPFQNNAVHGPQNFAPPNQFYDQNAWQPQRVHGFGQQSPPQYGGWANSLRQNKPWNDMDNPPPLPLNAWDSRMRDRSDNWEDPWAPCRHLRGMGFRACVRQLQYDVAKADKKWAKTVRIQAAQELMEADKAAKQAAQHRELASHNVEIVDKILDDANARVQEARDIRLQDIDDWHEMQDGDLMDHALHYSHGAANPNDTYAQAAVRGAQAGFVPIGGGETHDRRDLYGYGSRMPTKNNLPNKNSDELEQLPLHGV
ncbi:hypothetical protein DdX_01734 [Ditylenchus destructor]|uniref:Uncharacterized protein n=1 Tax=Ditylenchus destructor TaxID=166010 RepID=A0AAD4NG53_9BILA|nr:hypothetical protein DdX_01734 [Ditylenchus destructor]